MTKVERALRCLELVESVYRQNVVVEGEPSSTLKDIQETIAFLKGPDETPSSKWHAAGEPDPHAGHYDEGRAGLALGQYTDDELANGLFMNYDQPLSITDLVARTPGKYPPIVWATAAKERIRWLSRALNVKEKA